MLSIIPSSPSSFAYFLAGVLSLLLVMSVVTVKIFSHRLSKEVINIALLLCLLNYLFPMGGTDFYSYKEEVEASGFTDTSVITQYDFHMEKPYYYIINIVANNYLLFRMVVWGGSLLLLWITSIRFKLDKNAFIFYLGISIVHLTSTSRVVLAVALALFGFSYLIWPIANRLGKLTSYILGSLIMLSSFFFHRSVIFLLIVMLLSLVEFNKRTIWLFVLFVPTLFVVVISGIFDIVFTSDMSDASLLDKDTALYYLNSEKKSSLGIGRMLELILKYFAHISVVILIVKNFADNSIKMLPNYVRKLANITVLINGLALSVLLLPDVATFKTFERLIDFSYVPMGFLLAYMFKSGFEKLWTDRATLFLMGYVVFGIFYYNIYFSFINFK